MIVFVDMDRFKKALPLIVFAIFFFGHTANIHAQDSVGIKLVPAVIETRANPGEVIQETVVVTNLNSEEKEYLIVSHILFDSSENKIKSRLNLVKAT